MAIEDDDEQLTTAEVAHMFRVDPKTVGRWAKAGKLTFTRTMGGHKRFSKADIRAYIAGTREEARYPLKRTAQAPEQEIA